MIELNSYRRESLKCAKILPFRFSPFFFFFIFLVFNFCHRPECKTQSCPQRYQNFATLRSYTFPHFRQITFTCLIYVKEFVKIPWNGLCHGVLLYS